MGRENPFGINPGPDAGRGLQEKLVAGRAPDVAQWKFSFQYWDQIRLFGLNHSTSSWFVSLLERLRQLSKFTIEEFLRSIQLRGANRYHEIDWDAKNCPIKREDIYWLPPQILANEKDFPFVQVHISRALGRIVGFFDNNNIFNIVLLDPLHNIQPSKYVNYRIRDCDKIGCQYTTLIYKISNIIDKRCKHTECENIQELKQALSARDELLAANCAMIFISERDIDWFEQLRQSGVVDSIDDVFTAGLEVKLAEIMP